jgi:uncharacterized protein YpmS
MKKTLLALLTAAVATMAYAADVADVVSKTKNEPQAADADTRPAALPQVSLEKANELNEKAIESYLFEKEKKEPFFRLYQEKVLDSIIFEGTIRGISLLSG